MLLSLLLAGCPVPEEPASGDSAQAPAVRVAASRTFDTDAACAAGAPVLYGEVRDRLGACEVCKRDGLALAAVAWNPCEEPLELVYGCFVEQVAFTHGDDGADGVSDCDGPNTLTLAPGERHEELPALDAGPASGETWTWAIDFGDVAGSRDAGTFTVL